MTVSVIRLNFKDYFKIVKVMLVFTKDLLRIMK